MDNTFTLHLIGCTDEEFECNDGQCIPSEGFCDGTKDCNNGDDEDPESCMHTTVPYDPEANPTDADFTTEFDPEPQTDDENEPEVCK